MHRLVPPPALGALLLLALLLGLAWTVVTPPWQSPDENSHFGYVQHLVEAGELPGNPDRPTLSGEQSQAQVFSNADQAAAQPLVPMELRPAVEAEWRERDAALDSGSRRDGGGANPASSNPPLYYLSVAPGYLLTRDASVFTRLWAMRAISVLWLLLSVVAGWLLAREVFGPDDDRAAVAVAGLAALAPMTQFISASISPDAALFAVWTLVLWMGVRVLKRGATPRRAAALGALVGVAILTKATSYALVPCAGLALLVAAFRARRVAPVLAGGAALAAVVLPWFLLASTLDREAAAQVGVVAGQSGFVPNEFASYLWQYYLPRLGFMNDFRTVAETLPAYDLLLKGSLGAFGWLEVTFPEWVYIAASVVVVAVLLALATRVRRLDLPAAFLVVTAVALLAGLHVSEYPQLKAGASNFIQGRYLLPLVGIAGVGVVAASRLLPRRLGAPALGVLLGALLVLDLWGLLLTFERFHA